MKNLKFRQFALIDHPITYTYQKVILKSLNGEFYCGFFDKNNFSETEQQYLSNTWNFTIITGLKEVTISGDDIEWISLYQNNALIYHISDKALFQQRAEEVNTH